MNKPASVIIGCVLLMAASPAAEAQCVIQSIDPNDSVSGFLGGGDCTIDMLNIPIDQYQVVLPLGGVLQVTFQKVSFFCPDLILRLGATNHTGISERISFNCDARMTQKTYQISAGSWLIGVSDTSVPAGSYTLETQFTVTDADADGFPDALDSCSTVFNTSQTDTDSDGFGDVCDGDDDSDGVADLFDAFPLDPAESLDTDNDGIGNNADTDDDGDGMSDVFEIMHGFDPLDGSDASFDLDEDGLSNLEEFVRGRNPRVNETSVIQIINLILLSDE